MPFEPAFIEAIPHGIILCKCYSLHAQKGFDFQSHPNIAQSTIWGLARRNDWLAADLDGGGVDEPVLGWWWKGGRHRGVAGLWPGKVCGMCPLARSMYNTSRLCRTDTCRLVELWLATCIYADVICVNK